MGRRGLRTQTVYPADVKLHLPRAATGRPRTHPVPTQPRQRAADVLAGVRWRRVTWRAGTKGPLAARFAAVRVRIADGPQAPRTDHLPGEVAWLVGEWRSSGERKYYLANHPERTPLRTLAATIKARWSCEQAHQQLKEALGLDHFEGRSWIGLHHHVLLTQIAFAFLQHLRLRDVSAAARGRGENVEHPLSSWSATSADAANRTAANRAAPFGRRAAMSNMRGATHVRAARVKRDVAE